MSQSSLSMSAEPPAPEVRVAPRRAAPTAGWVRVVDRLLLGLACIALVATLVDVALGIVARQVGWNIIGLDGYAGYAIAAALFLALPATLRRGDHIRVTLLLQKLPERGRDALEYWALTAGLGLSLYAAFFACRLVWVSYLTHDVSTASDATPLWIPQIAMALGCIGFALGFADALLARLQGREYFEQAGDEPARVE